MMWKELADLAAQPEIVVRECAGDLQVRGDEAQRLVVQVDGGEHDLQLERAGERISLVARSSCQLICPRGSQLVIGTVSGELELVGVDGRVQADAVAGDVNLRNSSNNNVHPFGIFVGAALLILVVFIFIVGDLQTLFRKSGYPLSVEFASAAGLENGDGTPYSC